MARSDAATVMRLVDEAGFNSIRDDAYWSGVERARGVLEFPARYAESRKAMQAAGATRRTAHRHPRVRQPVLRRRWLSHFGPPELPRTRATRASSHTTLRDSVRQFEVWNEWNSGFGSKPAAKSGAAAEYARMLAPAAAAIRAANPDAEVIGGATAGVDLAWLREFIAAGGLAHLDAVSVHSYTLFRYRTNPEGAIQSLDRLHALLASRRARRDHSYLRDRDGLAHATKAVTASPSASREVPGALHDARALPAVDRRRVVV